MKTKLDWALEHAGRGFSVFPLMPNSKKPPAEMDRWQYRATKDEAQIRQWWTRWPDANIAGFTGSHFVVDIDPRNGGEDTFQALRLHSDFPRTLVSQTAGGGNHLVYTLPPHTVVRKGKLGPGIDVQSWGAYIVLPGSTIDGREYVWLNDREPAEALPWMLEHMAQTAPKSADAGKRVVHENDAAVALAEKFIRDWSDEIPEGDRDTTAFRVAARLYDFGAAEATVHALLADWNATRCAPPLEPADIARLASSAGRNRREPIGIRNPEYSPGLEPVDPDRLIAAKGSPAKPDKFRSISAHDAAAKALEARGRALVKGLLDCSGMSVLYGESGGGKTFVATDLAYHVASGTEWRGRRVHKGLVVYLAAEGGRGIYARMAALEAHYGSLADIPFRVLAVPVDFIHGAGDLHSLLAEVRRLEAEFGQKCELVIVDTLSRAIGGGDENSSVDMGTMVKALDLLREGSGAHVMTVHHTGKDKAKGARGHSLLRAATDTEIEIDNGVLSVTKQRDMDGILSVGFRLVPVQIGVDSDGDPVTSCVVEACDKEFTVREKQPLTGEAQQLAAALWAHLAAEYDTSVALPDTLAFKTATAVDICSRLSPKNARVHQENARAFAQTVTRLMNEMHDNAHLIKLKKGQWLIRDARNAQNAQHIQANECTDAHGS